MALWNPLIILLITVLNIYTFFLTVWIVLSLLIYFDIVNSSNNFVRKVMVFLNNFIEPALNKIRTIIPLVGNVDISPMVLYLALEFVKNVLHYLSISV